MESWFGTPRPTRTLARCNGIHHNIPTVNWPGVSNRPTDGDASAIHVFAATNLDNDASSIRMNRTFVVRCASSVFSHI